MTIPKNTSAQFDSSHGESLSASTCGTCANYDPSRLEGFGYCKAAPSLESLARLVAIGRVCVFDKWHAKGLS